MDNRYVPLNLESLLPPEKVRINAFFLFTTIINVFFNEGVTITACPLSDDYSNRHLVEVFSAGWHHKSIFQRHESSPALSVEFLPDIYDFNEYLVTWLELSRRPPVAEGIGKSQVYS